MAPKLKIVAPDAALPEFGGGGNDGGMEARLANIESRIAGVEDVVGKVGLDVSEIKGQLKAMPTAFQMFSFCVGTVISMAALIFVIIRYAAP